MLLDREGGGGVEIAFEANEITHACICVSPHAENGVWGDLRGNSIVEYHIHPALVDLRDRVAPGVDVTKMLIQKRCIQCRVTVCAPGLVHKDRSGQINALSESASHCGHRSVRSGKPT